MSTMVCTTALCLYQQSIRARRILVNPTPYPTTSTTAGFTVFPEPSMTPYPSSYYSLSTSISESPSNSVPPTRSAAPRAPPDLTIHISASPTVSVSYAPITTMSEQERIASSLSMQGWVGIGCLVLVLLLCSLSQSWYYYSKAKKEKARRRLIEQVQMNPAANLQNKVENRGPQIWT